MAIALTAWMMLLVVPNVLGEQVCTNIDNGKHLVSVFKMPLCYFVTFLLSGGNSGTLTLFTFIYTIYQL